MAKIALSEKIENCLIASAWVKPESKIVDTPEIYKIINPSGPFGFLNGIYRTNLNSLDIEAVIAAHYSSFKEHQISFRWYTFPHSKPTNLENILKVHSPSSITEMQGLYIEEKNYITELPPDVTVEELSKENLAEYIQANNEGWEQTEAQAEKVKAEIKKEFESGKMRYGSFLARYKGRPAATALLRIVDGSGYLQGGSCSPKYRGRGLYRGLVAHRLSVLKQNGIGLALVSARKDTSAPICRKLGFQVGCECRCFNFNF